MYIAGWIIWMYVILMFIGSFQQRDECYYEEENYYGDDY